MKCLFCGGELCWNSDYDVEGDDGIISSYTCMKCGRDYEITDPPREERETTYKDYWNNKKDSE